MTPQKISREIKSEIKELFKNPENIKDYSRFYKKDGKNHIGLSSSATKKLISKYFLKIKNFDKDFILALSDDLLRAGYWGIAFGLAFKTRKKFAPKDSKIFENWIKKYVDDWSKCDDLCAHLLGYFVSEFSEVLPKIKLWAKSPNKWLRRASAVCLIVSLRKGKYLKNAFEIADKLLSDKDYLVQKGYGWMLKEASRLYQEKVFDFVCKNKKIMPRLALRYAIEKMPEKIRREAMKK